MHHIPRNRAPQHPGEILFEDYLQPMGMTQTELAKALGITYARLNELIHGKRGLTVDTALRLERYFGVSAQSWLNAQLRWELYHATHTRKTEQALAKIRPRKVA